MDIPIEFLKSQQFDISIKKMYRFVLTKTRLPKFNVGISAENITS